MRERFLCLKTPLVSSKLIYFYFILFWLLTGFFIRHDFYYSSDRRLVLCGNNLIRFVVIVSFLRLRNFRTFSSVVCCSREFRHSSRPCQCLSVDQACSTDRMEHLQSRDLMSYCRKWFCLFDEFLLLTWCPFSWSTERTLMILGPRNAPLHSESCRGKLHNCGNEE